ncbi:MAG TPA: IS110 family transposase [Solirubrobacteraceae bacterium]|nr:IS110 family transposase [Solirubrobacteraceae bacterium]
MGRYAGVDWASEKHDVLVQSEAGDELFSGTFTHDEAGITALCRTLVRLEVQLVAIERPDGLLIERMLDAGLRVMAIHPNQVHAARPRFRTSGGKSDRFDAFVLCELARTDSHRFRVLVADSDETKALRALSRAREDLVQTRVELANQLRAELERFWPGATLIFDAIDSPIGLAFLERYPSPLDAKSLGEKRLGAFLARHSYCGRKKPAEMLAKLRDAPQGRTGESEIEARRAIVLALVAALRPIVAKISELTSEIAHRIRTHPDGQIFLSLFRDPKSVLCAAALLAEIGDCRQRYPNAEALAADAGMSPVAVESGKRKVATFRWGCDKRLRQATSTLADATRHWHPWAQDRYAASRARGHDHPRAIRTLGRAWCRVLWRCWQDRAPYDPARHHGLQQHITVTIPSQSGPRPDMTATQRMASAAVTRTAAQTAEREALDGKPTSATTLGG